MWFLVVHGNSPLLTVICALKAENVFFNLWQSNSDDTSANLKRSSRSFSSSGAGNSGNPNLE